ncbi:MAG: globin domain-containing protein [Pseudomonadota bacterium]
MTEIAYLTPDEAALVDRSFAKLLPISGLAAELFHARLAQTAPSVQAAFTAGTTVSDETAMHWLGVIVTRLDKPEALETELRDIAGRLVARGLTPADYDRAGEALLWTVEMGLGDAFDDATRDAWSKAYALMSEVMVRSAYAPAGAAAAAE